MTLKELLHAVRKNLYFKVVIDYTTYMASCAELMLILDQFKEREVKKVDFDRGLIRVDVK